MKNIYDDEQFFNEYSKMARSQQGLAGAGEWETLKSLLPDFSGLRVLDMGCGYGWHSIYAAEHGAKKVIGIDSSEKMLEVAREKNEFDIVEFEQIDINSLPFDSGSFDVVFSSLALHYIQDFEGVIKQVYRLLAKNGKLIFSVEHPIFTAEGSEQWRYKEDGTIDSFPVDRYFEEGVRETNFWETTVTKYHRTLTTYIDTLILQGFNIERVIEPTPPESMLDMPGMKDESRRPMMLIISASKKD
ncbi:methyltransferase [Companilactobacillus sp. RD055328]|uniref:class I SAM-dependent methyltransferase n=1 Tax=Companilactobacillus sp. RD055328 TaxID=2916634 RepID=UPI001FC7EF9E|nr:class I SAM-dependent methyltransferase [Companilactobacillus sp. RD055328]GKQ42410.1 methyltransferase [Companilactobacillus sp. RD055328]